MRLTVLMLCLLAASARAQDFGPSGMPQMPQAPTYQQPTAGLQHDQYISTDPNDPYQVTWDSSPDNSTTFEVDAPAGFDVVVTEHGRRLTAGTIPLSFAAQGGHRYHFRITGNFGTPFERDFKARTGMTARLMVTPTMGPRPNTTEEPEAPSSPPPPVATEPAPAEPSPVAAPASRCADEDLVSKTVEDLHAKGFDSDRMPILKARLRNKPVCAAQVHQLMHEFQYFSSRAEALAFLKPAIVDLPNASVIWKDETDVDFQSYLRWVFATPSDDGRCPDDFVPRGISEAVNLARSQDGSEMGRFMGHWKICASQVFLALATYANLSESGPAEKALAPYVLDPQNLKKVIYAHETGPEVRRFICNNFGIRCE